jgi:copper chaperone CopZ
MTNKTLIKNYKIVGMNCASCASMIELDLEDAGIKAKCSYPNSTLEIKETHDPKKVVETLKKSGYSVSPVE